jgi:hypothetical protein
MRRFPAAFCVGTVLLWSLPVALAGHGRLVPRVVITAPTPGQPGARSSGQQLPGYYTTSGMVPAAVLSYNLVFSPRLATSPATGRVRGWFGGVPVAGAFRGTASSGTLTLTVREAVLAEGTYSCPSSGCFLGRAVAGRRVEGMSMSGLDGVGQSTSSAFPTHQAWVLAVSNWAATHFDADQAASIVSAASTDGAGMGGMGGGIGGKSGGGMGGGAMGGGKH